MEESDKSKGKSQKSKKQQYNFPSVSPCPRCHNMQTRATSTQGNVQYRKCMAPICQERYTVIGQKVKSKKVKSKKVKSKSSSLSSSSSSSSA